MALFEEQTRTLTVKLVYYGPAMSGKTTNLMTLHDRLASPLKGELMMLETKDDRTLFFDLLPLGFRTPSGWLVKFKVFTVPGQVQHDSTRKSVLSRCDGVVFVADSQVSQATNNGEAFDNLIDNLQKVGIDFQKVPIVVQFNKRDLSNILTESEVRTRWAEAPWPLYFASASNGVGVVETFAEVLTGVYRNLERESPVAEVLQLDEAGFISAALG